MNTDNNIEELFEAAKRHEKDMQRQQHLSDMVDLWAAAESSAEAISGTAVPKRHNRKPIWITIGIAASILLMVSIGLRSLLPQTSAEGSTIVAENKSDTAIMTDEQSPTESISDTEWNRASMAKPTIKNQLIAETSTEKPSCLDALCDNADTIPQQNIEEVLLAQNDNSETHMATMDNSKPEPADKGERKIYERTSSRLVGRQNEKTSIRNRSNDRETHLIAFNSTGTTATYELGKTNF